MLSVAELEGMYEDTGGVAVRRPLGGGEYDETWGHLERYRADAFPDDFGRVVGARTELHAPAEALSGLSIGDTLETRSQEEGAEWRAWEVRDFDPQDRDADELVIPLRPIE